MIRAGVMHNLQQYRDQNPAEFRTLFTKVAKGDGAALGVLSQKTGVEAWDLMELAAAAGVEAVCAAKDKWALFGLSYTERFLNVTAQKESVPLNATLRNKGVFSDHDLVAGRKAMLELVPAIAELKKALQPERPKGSDLFDALLKRHASDTLTASEGAHLRNVVKELSPEAQAVLGVVLSRYLYRAGGRIEEGAREAINDICATIAAVPPEIARKGIEAFARWGIQEA